MNDLRKAAQDVIDCVDSPYIPDEIRMVDVKCIEALRQAVQAEQDVPVYTPMTIEEHQRVWGKSYPGNPAYNFNDAIDWADEITLERAVIERLGLRWPE